MSDLILCCLMALAAVLLADDTYHNERDVWL